MRKRKGEKWGKNRGGAFLEDEVLRGFPCESFATEVTVGRRSLVDGLLEVKLLDDFARAKVEVLLHDLQKLLLAFRRCAVAGGGGEGRRGARGGGRGRGGIRMIELRDARD